MTDGSNLSGWLARNSADLLADVLNHRPDVYWGPALRGLDDLASRLVRPASVAEAMIRLPLPGVELLHALAALGPAPTVANAAELLDSGDRSPSAQQDAVRGALLLLEHGALAWPADHEVIAVNPGARIVIDLPLGIGRTVASHLEHTPVAQLRIMLANLGLPDSSRRAEAAAALAAFLTDRRSLGDLLATAPESALDRLRTLSMPGQQEQGYYRQSQQDQEAENWARRRGLLYGGQYYAPEVPVEIALAVRKVAVSFHPDAPALVTQPVTVSGPSSVSSAAAAAAADFAETVAGLLDSMARSPLPALKAGGIGTREVARAAKALGVEDRLVRLALELIRALGLLAGDDGEVGPGTTAADWRADEPSARFADLAVAWWGLPVTPSLTHDADGKAIPAIGRRSADDTAMTLRWTVLDTIAGLAPGTGLTSAASLAEQLNWLLPGTIEQPDPAVEAIWAEAHALGVVTQGALTPIGAALLQRDPDALLSVAGTLLAPATSVGRFGSDLTVMVAGSPAAPVSALLDSCADRESRGAAVVWRFSPTTVRRALDDGMAADELVSALRAISESDLPQPLTYLIGDVQRRHGNLVVHSALSCVRSDDEALLIEVAAHRSLRTLRPVLLAPTVLAFQAEAPVVLVALRAAGYLPVQAAGSGVPVVDRHPDSLADDDAEPPARMVDRLRELTSRPSAGRAGEPPADVRRLAEAILATSVAPSAPSSQLPTFTEAAIQEHGGQLDPVEQRQLAFAIDHQLPVRITYQSGSGGVTTRTISDIELVGGLMYAWCHLRDDERAFAVDRVQAVRPVDA